MEATKGDLTPTIERLLAAGTPAPEALTTFLADHSFPLVEGPEVTFVYRGDVRAVSLQHWLYGLESSLPFTRIEGSDVWYLVLTMRRESRVEYKFLVDHGDRRELVRDPLNPHLAHDPFGANSVCHTDRYLVPEWTLPDPDARPGHIEERAFASEAFGEVRSLKIYVPARFRETRRYPLLVAQDGSDYLRFSALKTVLDNLIHRLEIPPMIVALSDPRDRLTEYAADERHARHIATELVPAVSELYPIVDTPGARGLMGASFGAVAALSTAVRHPGVFGRLFLQSGSFAFTDIGRSQRGPAFEPVVRFVNEFRDAPVKPAERIAMSCGIYESLIYENRTMLPVLQQTGAEVLFHEARDSHNWENWRDRMRDGLSWLFPGPLWMIYE